MEKSNIGVEKAVKPIEAPKHKLAIDPDDDSLLQIKPYKFKRERPVGITALEDRLRELGSDYLLDWNNEGAEQMPGVLIDLTMDEPSSESGDHDDVEEETKIKESEQK